MKRWLQYAAAWLLLSGWAAQGTPSYTNGYTGVGNPARPLDSNDSLFLPVYQVTQAGASHAQATNLAAVLHIPTNQLVWNDGMIFFIDPANFMAVPTITVTNTNAPAISNLIAQTKNPYPAIPVKVEALDFASLSNLAVYNTNAALAAASNAFAAVGLSPQFGTPHIVHTVFTTVISNADQTVTATHNYLDTEVSYQFSLSDRTNSYPLIGAGARAQVAFGSTGNVTLLAYAARQLTAGPSVQIITSTEASNRVANLLPPHAQFNLQLAYLAPPFWPSPTFPACPNCPLPAWNPANIIPYYAYNGTVTETNPVNGATNVVVLKGGMIPATDDTNYVPSATLSVFGAGSSQIFASVSASGGSPPYTYVWAGSTPALSISNGAAISYKPMVRIGPPPLAIAPASNASVRVLWPYPSTGFLLESTTNLAAPDWRQVGSPVQTNNGMNMVTVPATNNLFLRLRLAIPTLPATDTLDVTVTDANGVSVHASQTLNVQAAPFPLPTGPGDPPSYGTESPYDVGFFGYDTGAWVTAMQATGGGAGTIYRTQLDSWPGDFVESSPAGSIGWVQGSGDTSDATVPVIYVDADLPNWGVNTANLVFYTGHGNTPGFSFTYPDGPVSTSPANILQLNHPGVDLDASYSVMALSFNGYMGTGEYDLGSMGEWGSLGSQDDILFWLIFDGCFMLQYNFNDPNDSSPPVTGMTYAWNVWGNAWNGLHVMLGFQNESFGGFGTAETFADFILGNSGFSGPSAGFDGGGYVSGGPPAKIVQAWIAASEFTQPSGWELIFAGGNAFQPVVPAATGPIQFAGTFDFLGVSLPFFVMDVDDFYPGLGSMGPSIGASQVGGFWYLNTEMQ